MSNALVKAIDELSEFVLNNHEAYAVIANSSIDEHDYFGFGGLYWEVVKQAAACNLTHAVPEDATCSTECWKPEDYDEFVIGIEVLCNRESFLIELSKLRALVADDTKQADSDDAAVLAMLGDDGAKLLEIARCRETVEKRMSDLLVLRPEWLGKPASWWANVLGCSESAVKHKANETWQRMRKLRAEGKDAYPDEDAYHDEDRYGDLD